MPQKPCDYSKTKIYKIVCKDPIITNTYVGHTTDIIRRKAQHKRTCNNPNNRDYNIYLYQFIREKGGWENWSLIVIEDYPCLNKNEAERKEREYIENIGATLNKQIPTRSKSEYYETNKDDIKLKKKIYNTQNKEKRALNDKIWRENNQEKVSEKNKYYYEENKAYIKSQQKELRENNKPTISTRNKMWRENNQEKVKEKNKSYYENNQDNILRQKKEYYLKNKEKILNRKKEKEEKQKSTLA
jgi:hypothetical protein